MKKVLIHLSVFTFFALLFSVAILPVFADNQSIDLKPSAVGPVNASANQIVRFTINALIIVGVVVSLIFLLYGGIRWIISGGDKAKVDAARSAIVASIVGLIIVILAYVIVNTVLTVLTGNGIGGFVLPSLTNPEGAPKP